MWWYLKSPASRLLTLPFIQAQIKENIKTLRHWPLCGEFTGDQWIPLTVTQKMFPFDDIIMIHFAIGSNGIIIFLLSGKKLIKTIWIISSSSLHHEKWWRICKFCSVYIPVYPGHFAQCLLTHMRHWCGAVWHHMAYSKVTVLWIF